MPTLDFPSPPTLNEVWIDPLGQRWIYNGDAWVRNKLGTGIPEPTKLSTQMARQVDQAGLPGKWVNVAVDIWYLGPFNTPPHVDNNGDPLVEGHVYYDLITLKMYSWDSEAWRPFAPTYEIFGLTSYQYELTAPLLNVPLTGTDIYGNTPSGWTNGQTLITVFRKQIGETGASRLSSEIDINIPQDFTVDYNNSQVTPVHTQWEIGDIIVIQISQIQLGNDASTFPWVDADPTLSANTDTKVPTQKAVKTYIDFLESRVLEIPGRNALSNGGFNIWQRGDEFTPLTNWVKYNADRWYVYDDNITVSRTAARWGSGRKYGMKISGGAHRVKQVILNPDQFIPGAIWTFSCSTLASQAGNIRVDFWWGSSAKENVVSTYVDIPVTSSDDGKRFSGQLTIPNRGINNDTLALIRVTSANSGDELFDLQFEEGMFASKFERLNISDEIHSCGRHCQSVTYSGYYPGYISTGVVSEYGLLCQPITLPVPMAKSFQGSDLDDGRNYYGRRLDGDYTTYAEFRGAYANAIARQGEYNNEITHWRMQINNNNNQPNASVWSLYTLVQQNYPLGATFLLDAEYY